MYEYKYYVVYERTRKDGTKELTSALVERDFAIFDMNHVISVRDHLIREDDCKSVTIINWKLFDALLPKEES